jgi:hypothetical protein
MQRVGPAWLLGLPLLVIGWLAAHAVTYDLVVADPHERARVLAASGHGYLDHAPLLAAGCAVLVAGGLLLRARGRGTRRIPAWAFAVAPVVAFAVQELLERQLHDGSVAWGTLLEPVVLVGLALQLPFALVAALVGRALTGLADAFAEQKSSRPPLAGLPEASAPCIPERRQLGVLAVGHAGRAPPLPA